MKPWFGPAVPAACDEAQLARRVERLVTWLPRWSAGLEPAWDKSAQKGRLQTGAPRLLVLVCATLLASQPARAQFSQQGPKLMGTGVIENDQQGISVSLSADGNTAVVGANIDNGGAGAVWVWTRSGGVWTQQGTKLVGSGAVGRSAQGWSVSLSADGNTAIVGAIDDNSNAGAAWIWARSAGLWTQQGTKLLGSGGVGVALQGRSVSLSADGNTAIVGGYYDNSGAGAAWVFTASAPPAAPTFITQPVSRTVNAGQNASFTAFAIGSSPLSYQWRFNGAPIPRATSATLTLNSIGAGNSGGYSVSVSNPHGSAASATAHLAVFTDGANEQAPTQITAPTLPAKETGKNNLVVVTHGWLPKEVNLLPGNPPPVLPAWVTSMADDIKTQVSKVSTDWQVLTFDWALDAWAFSPDTAFDRGKIKGKLLGQQIAAKEWKHVHLIGHSAGSAVIQAAVDAVINDAPGTEIHTTFLDPFLRFNFEGRGWFGSGADWSDSYFADDLGTSFVTGGRLPLTHNVNVTWLDKEHITYVTSYCYPSGMAGTTFDTIFDKQVGLHPV